MLTPAERVEIAVGLRVGETQAAIAARIGRDRSVVSREIRRNRNKNGEYVSTTAGERAAVRRRRPQAKKLDGDPVLFDRVVSDMRLGRSPRQIAGRLRLEAQDATVGCMDHSAPAEGKTVSHEAIYTWIYAMPTNRLKALGVTLESKRSYRRPRRELGQRTGPIVGMRSIHDRPAQVEGRAVPGHWEGDLIIGAGGKSAVATLVERTSRFLVMLALPQGKSADGLADALIETYTGLPDLLRGSLTWDQGTEMARHAELTVAADLPVFFADPHSPWQRGSNENTNRLIRRYLPKGTVLPHHQGALDAIAKELNEKPRQTLGFFTPREVLSKILNEGRDSDPNVATTS
jgi:transposase, IS30 family